MCHGGCYVGFIGSVAVHVPCISGYHPGKRQAEEWREALAHDDFINIGDIHLWHLGLSVRLFFPFLHGPLVEMCTP